jgi:microcin C transport system permease protein
MTQYFLRRLLLIIPTFFGITLMVFVITRFVPGGPIERALMEAQVGGDKGAMQSDYARRGGSVLSEAQLQQLREYYGFDKPVLTSYLQWVRKVLVLDLGYSTRYNEPVWQTIKERLPVSVFYGLSTMVLTYIFCIPLGIVKAVRHGSAIDHITSALIFVGYAVPGFVVGILLLVLFASTWEIFPLGGFVSDSFEDLGFFGKIGDLFYHAALPLLAYLLGSFAVMTFMMKNSLLENLSADYIRTAMAKGLPFRRAVFGHALRNSLIPVATTFGENISFFLTGSFLIEKVFNIDGFGLLGYDSLVERDYPVVMGILAIAAFLYLLGNILSDFCVALVDPRVKFGQS